MWDKEKLKTRTICGTKKSIEQGQYGGQEKHRTRTICGTKKNIHKGQYVGQRKA